MPSRSVTSTETKLRPQSRSSAPSCTGRSAISRPWPPLVASGDMKRAAVRGPPDPPIPQRTGPPAPADGHDARPSWCPAGASASGRCAAAAPEGHRPSWISSRRAEEGRSNGRRRSTARCVRARTAPGGRAEHRRRLFRRQVEDVAQDDGLALLVGERPQGPGDQQLVLDRNRGDDRHRRPVPLASSPLSPPTPPCRSRQVHGHVVGPTLGRLQLVAVRPAATCPKQRLLRELLGHVDVTAVVRHRPDQPWPGSGAEPALVLESVAQQPFPSIERGCPLPATRTGAGVRYASIPAGSRPADGRLNSPVPRRVGGRVRGSIATFR